MLACAGCDERDAPQPYQVFTGAVRYLDQDTGELFVRPEQTPKGWQPGRNILCVVTNDSEIYINDCFRGIEDIRVGDAIELAGYRDRERFVVSLGNITRSQAALRSPPETRPAGESPKE